MQTTVRSLPARTFGNFYLSLLELYIRSPQADRFAIFQDDCITYRNLRSYLSHSTTHDQAYWNLYTFPSNQTRVQPDFKGWFQSHQLGRGAVGLVFTNRCVRLLLTHRRLIEKPTSVNGHQNVDGCLIETLKSEGWKEYVHSVSLVQHIGDISSMNHRQYPKATSFKGEEFDAMELL